MLIVLGHELTYFVKHETKGIKGDAENKAISMFLIDDMFVEFRGHIFQQIIGFPIGKNVSISLPTFSYIYMRMSL